MANNMIDFPSGLTFHTTRAKSKFFKDLKKILVGIHTPFFDCSCEVPVSGVYTPLATDSLPVRVNPTSSVLEYFDGNNWVSFGGLNVQSTSTGLTASTTQTQVGALALPASFNNISTVANAGDAVRLPVIGLGKTITVKNSGVSPLQVFPATGNSIDGGTANASIFIAPGKEVSFTGTSATNSTSSTSAASTGAAINSTATATAAQVATGLITSTSAASTTITLPTATQLGTQVAASRGKVVDLIVDNSAGASTVTVALATGVTQPGTVVITGSNILTVASGEVGAFKFIFTSPTTAKLFRTS